MKPTLVAGLLAAATAIGGCGLKGPLYLPEKSGDVVIRGPSSSTPPEPAGPAGEEAIPAEALPPPPDPQIPL